MSLSLPSVSVVMPNFNHGKYIRTALEAMVTQSVPPLEIIVVDDASTDDSWAIIQELATRHVCIQPVRNKSNQGVVSAMNLGLRLAQGDYVHFGAADDQIYPGLYEKSLTLLRDHPLASFSCTIGDWHEVTTGFNWHMGVGMAEHPSYLAPRELVGLEQVWRLFIPSHTALVRRAAALEVGGFIPELKWHCDWFLLYTSAFRHGICHVPEPLGRFNIFGSSYYKSGRRDAYAHRAVLQGIMERLVSPEFNREGELLREAGSLYEFAGPMREVMRADPRFRHFLTGRFLRRSCWHSLKLAVKDHLPVWLANVYFRLAGYRAAKSA